MAIKSLIGSQKVLEVLKSEALIENKLESTVSPPKSVSGCRQGRCSWNETCYVRDQENTKYPLTNICENKMHESRARCGHWNLIKWTGS